MDECKKFFKHNIKFINNKINSSDTISRTGMRQQTNKGGRK